MAWNIKRNDFPTIAARLRQGAQHACDDAAARVESAAAAAAPRKSGALSGSIYSLTPAHDGYDAAVDRVLEAAPDSEDVFSDSGADEELVLPRVVLPATAKSARSKVISAVTYAIWVEFGDFDNPARYFLKNALEGERARFAGDLAGLMREIGAGPQAAVKQISPEVAEARAMRAFRAESNATKRELASERHNFVGARVREGEMHRITAGTGTTASGARKIETMQEKADRLEQAFYELRDAWSETGGNF